jgi:hypothetical protein
MSEIKVNKLTPRTNCGTVTLGDSGDTFTIPSGATINNLGTASGFGATGAVNWDVASIKTVDFTAVSGVGYFVDTATTGAVIVTLPAAPAVGDVVGVADYAKNFSNANCTLNRNSLNIGGVAVNATLSTDGVAVTLVYVDVTKGWIVTDSGNQSDAPTALYVAATGGCITTCGNYKIHTFFSPGTFTVSCGGNGSGSETVSYMIAGGGGGGGSGDGACAYDAGGGGAGGYRESKASTDCYTASPLNATSGCGYNIPVSGTPGSYAVVVDGGGAGSTYTGAPSVPAGTPGGVSSALGISAAGGGGGGSRNTPSSPTLGGQPGGSGGGAGQADTCAQSQRFGTGNQPVTSPPQGNDGGRSAFPTGSPGDSGGGAGGGAGAVGGNASGGNIGGCGGAGTSTAINLTTMPAPSPTPSSQIGTPGPTPAVRYFAGGGGGAGTPNSGGCGGVGGGGTGSGPGQATTAGTINTGSGGGAGSGEASRSGGNGGSGIVVIRYKYQ